MLLVNLERIASMFECRREIANCYQNAIGDLVERSSTGVTEDHSFYSYTILTDRCDELTDRLRNLGREDNLFYR